MRSPNKAVSVLQDPSHPLRNTRHESFALAVAKGTSEADAYRTAYPKTREWKNGAVYPAASRLNAKVLPRIEFLRGRMTERGILTVQEKLEMLSTRTRKAYNGLAGILDIMPDGTRTIDINKDNACLVKKATARIETSGEGDGQEDAAFVSVEVHDFLPYMQEHSKLAGHYPDPKLRLINQDGEPLELARIEIVETRATLTARRRRKED